MKKPFLTETSETAYNEKIQRFEAKLREQLRAFFPDFEVSVFEVGGFKHGNVFSFNLTPFASEEKVKVEWNFDGICGTLYCNLETLDLDAAVWEVFRKIRRKVFFHKRVREITDRIYNFFEKYVRE